MIWVDAQLSPFIAAWIKNFINHDCKALREVGLRDAGDSEIFQAARIANAILITKDSDFVDLLNRLGPPPKIIWLTCGNTSNKRLTEIFSNKLAQAIELLSDADIVEIAD